MTDGAYKDLSGAWTGVFDYPMAAMDPATFSASLVDHDGLLTGEIFEQNTMARVDVDTLLSTISGNRLGSRVTFVKRYEDLPGLTHEVTYEGEVSSDLSRIEGTWHIASEPAWWRGPFVMTRPTQATTEQQIAAEIGQD